MTADVPFYVELARQADGPLVELAVGNGRVAIPVAQATGRRVIGIDTSPAMLEQARERAAEAGSSSSCTSATCAISRSTSRMR
jgi:ubiquinone/menaquinone biosynthesis C-methylase UbiE